MTTLKKILYVLPNAELGGAEKFSFEMISHHHQRGRYEPLVLFLNSGSLEAIAREMKVRQFTLSRPFRLRQPASFLRAIRECGEIIQREEIDLVHSCMAYGHLVGGMAARENKVPSVYFQHGPVGGALDVVASLVPARCVLVNSQFTATQQEKFSLIHRPIHLLQYGMEAPRDSTNRSSKEIFRGLPTDALVLAIVARFDPWKGIDVAIEACADLLRTNSRIKLLVVGGPFRHFHPNYLEKLHSLVERLQVKESVVFEGFQSNVQPFLERADILLHTSIRPEPFGITVVEGMAAGKAVIASRAGGVMEIITDGQDGLLHTPGDVADLSEKIRTLVDNPRLREALGIRAKRTVVERFSSSRMMESLEGLYDSLLGHGTSVKGLIQKSAVMLLLLWGGVGLADTIWFEKVLGSRLTIGDVPDPRVSSAVTRALSRQTRLVPSAVWTELSDLLSPQPVDETAVNFEEFLNLRDPGEDAVELNFKESSSIAKAMGNSRYSSGDIKEDAELVLRAIAPLLKKAKGGGGSSELNARLATTAFAYIKALQFVAYGVLYEDGSLFLDWAVERAIRIGNELHGAIATKVASTRQPSKALGAYSGNAVHAAIKNWLTQIQLRIVDMKTEEDWPK